MTPQEFETAVQTDPKAAVLSLINTAREAKDGEDFDEAEFIGNAIQDDLEIGEIAGVTFEEVNREGTCEGGGEYSELVYALSRDGQEPFAHIRITGFYSSFNGTEWDDSVELVKPVEVMVTQYEPL